MVRRVTLADCAAKVGEYLDSTITHEQLIEWGREAMMADDIPPAEIGEIMDLLQDISLSTPRSLREAAKHYRALNSPLMQGIPRGPRRNQ